VDCGEQSERHAAGDVVELDVDEHQQQQQQQEHAPPAKGVRGRPRRRQQQQQQQQRDSDVEVVDCSSPGTEQPQQLDNQHKQRLLVQLCSPKSPVGAVQGWNPPFPLDGSVAVTEQQLLASLASFHSVHATECNDCAESLREAAAGQQEARSALEAQRAVLHKLLQGNVQESLEPGQQYYLVPK
jgi:hypothetical protein